MKKVKCNSHLTTGTNKPLSVDLQSAFCALNPGGCTVHSLTHTGRDVVQAGLQSAAALLCTVADVCLQEGDAKLPLVDHADQAAAGLARALPCSAKHRSHTDPDPWCITVH